MAIAEAEARAITLKSVEIARMLGYTVEERTVTETDEDGEEKTPVVYRILFDETHTGADIAEYMKYVEYLAKWDGKLPQVVTDSSGIMITVPSTDGEDGN